jgi:hypothetical protein
MIDHIKSLTRRVPLRVWVALIGAAVGIACSHLPSTWRAPCDLASRMIPSDCSDSSQGDSQ